MTVADVLAARTRFWANVGPPTGEHGCRLWQLSLYQKGYPQFVVRSNMNVRGHRFAWIAAGKTRFEIAKRLRAVRSKCVRHWKCDTRACCEPRHLRPGTCQQNVADMVRRNRQSRGVRHYAAKLTRDRVLLLRKMVSGGTSCAEVGRALGLHPSNVSRVARGLTYSEVA